MNLGPALDQWKNVWTALSMRQRISIGVIAVIAVGGLLGFSWWRQQADFKPLFTKIEGEEAGLIVQKLKERGTEYKVADDGSTILVPSAMVAETRVSMAAQGLPKTGRMGFELFDKANLGVTDFAEHVNYRRALEGELERSIRSVSGIEEARVHLTFPKDSVFLESRQAAKASVVVGLKPRTELTEVNVSAICHLVASAVEGLAPSAVSVLDTRGNLLNKPKKAQEGSESSDEAIEYRQKVEKDLLAKMNATLEPLVGAGRFRTGVSVDCDFSSGEQSEETYDPEKSVMTTSTKTEELSGGATVGGTPGTASNLPRPASRGLGPGSGVSKRSETISYQTSKLVRRLRLPQGGVKRISASILLDHTSRWEQQGGKMQRVLTPPSAESLRAIRELVSAAIGVTTTRGDQLVIETLPFDSTVNEHPPSTPDPKQQAAPQASPWLWPSVIDRRLEAGIILALVALGVFVVLKKRKKKPIKRTATGATELPAGHQAGALAAADGTHTGVLGATKQLADAEQSIKVARAARLDGVLEEVRKNIGTDATLAANVIRTWLDEGSEA